MGQRVARLLKDHPALELRSGVSDNDDGARAKALGVPVVADPREALDGVDVVVDFSAPPSCVALAPLCAERRLPYVLASTGLTPQDEAAIADAAQHTAILQAANLSTGVNVMLELVELAAQRLGRFCDIEVSEIHHRYKRDAPSGTALALGEAAQRGQPGLEAVYGRHGIGGERGRQEIGYAAVRGGDVSGEHTVYYFGEGERIEITHRSSTADIFAVGALRAAHWLLGKSPGRYAMLDVLRDTVGG
jgi:4-hydroxy-tetrahydrodipicolinate reductase